jgi:mannose-6-phosphate isomerase class I
MLLETRSRKEPGRMSGAPHEPGALRRAEPFDITGVKERLYAGIGGYEVVHRSPGLEIGVYVLVAPEPDRQAPHEDDEVYIVLEGTGTLEVEGEKVDLHEGHAVFVPAGAEHRFVGYEELSVLVIFEKWRR